MRTRAGLKCLLFPAIFGLITIRAAGEDLMTVPIEAVIKNVMTYPNYSQMCDGAMIEGKGIPLPIYGRLLDRKLQPTQRQIEVLQARRAELVPVLKLALSKLHPEKKPPAEEPEDKSEHSVRVDEFSWLYMAIVTDCQVIEALPELLDLEERLRAAIQYADEHPKSPEPDVVMDSWIYHPRKERDKMSTREIFLEFCRADQRDLLSLILLLLRQQRFEPLLESDFEKRYQEGTAAAEKQAEAAKESKVPFEKPDCISMPFTAKARNDVRALAQKFLDTVPPEQWRHDSH